MTKRKNAFYYFMVEQRQILERRGRRFPKGFNDVAGAVQKQWDDLKRDERAPYEQKAKEAKGIVNLHNKFTSNGESFADVNARIAKAEEEAAVMDGLVDDLTIGSETPVEARNFIVIKTIHSCEVNQNGTSKFWPLELSIAAFNLVDGMRQAYWTQIDTVKIPTGYTSDAYDTSEDTGLPRPGSTVFKENHRDYNRILTNVKKFAEEFLANYGPKYILFAMGSDIKSADGCLQWLSENATLNDDERSAMNSFLNKLAFHELPKLLLKFATIANGRDSNYKSVMVQLNLDGLAKQILYHGRYDYRENITCGYHDEKLDKCCRNIVLRMVYLILEEIVPPMGLEWKDRHKIENFVTKPSARNIVGTHSQVLPISGSSISSSNAIDPTPSRDNYYGGATSVGYIPSEGPHDPRMGIFAELDFPTLGTESSLNAFWGNSNENDRTGGRIGRGRGRIDSPPSRDRLNIGPYQPTVGRGRY